MKMKKKSAFKAVLSFEYTSIIKNKAFIISTVLIVVLLGLASFLPALIMSLSSDDSGDGDETGGSKIALVNNAYEKDDIIVKSIKNEFGNDYNVEVVKNEEDARNGVKNEDYSFAILLDKPLEYSYITLTQSIYDSTTDIVDIAVTSAYRTTELEKKGISAEESEKLLSASTKRSVVTLGTDQTETYISTYILIMVLYMAIISYGQLVSNSVVTEKSSRAMEMLITCASPSDLMFGKVIGAGLAGFTQMAVIFGVGAVSVPTMVNSMPDEIKSMFSFSAESAIFAVLFFVLAFFIYAFVFAAIASLVSRIEDLSNIMSPIMFVIIFAFIIVIIGMNSGELNSPIMIVTSYIPFTAPLSMFARMSMSDVAAWEVALSIAIQVVSIFILGKLAAAIYRIGVLLYGKPPRFREIFKMAFSKKARS